MTASAPPARTIEKTCICGAVFSVPMSRHMQGKGRTCSRPCSKRSQAVAPIKPTPNKFGQTEKLPEPPVRGPNNFGNRPPARVRPTAAEPPAWQWPIDDGGSVTCPRCERTRERGVRCQCEVREP